MGSKQAAAAECPFDSNWPGRRSTFLYYCLYSRQALEFRSNLRTTWEYDMFIDKELHSSLYFAQLSLQLKSSSLGVIFYHCISRFDAAISISIICWPPPVTIGETFPFCSFKRASVSCCCCSFTDSLSSWGWRMDEWSNATRRAYPAPSIDLD